MEDLKPLIILQLIALIYSLYFMSKVRKTSSNNFPLNVGETIQVIITLLLSPLLSIIVYYFGWKEKFPKKVKQVVVYFIIIFTIEFLIIFTFSYITAITFGFVEYPSFLEYPNNISEIPGTYQYGPPTN